MKKFLTPEEAADYLKVSESELYEIVDNGKVNSYKIGGLYTRFRVDELNSYRQKTPSNKAGAKLYSSKEKRHASRPCGTVSDRIKDFFYFNDFYIYAFFVIAITLYFIFR
ncbi:MAG: helix-turn-helix domain-containing protein [Candidatus Omnitrophica bacterium]|nr:helix-turn-helix domain-containing protein [Candidatus Omnitrophota bacterium]